jgi:hypothetical protein
MSLLIFCRGDDWCDEIKPILFIYLFCTKLMLIRTMPKVCVSPRLTHGLRFGECKGNKKIAVFTYLNKLLTFINTNRGISDRTTALFSNAEAQRHSVFWNTESTDKTETHYYF